MPSGMVERGWKIIDAGFSSQPATWTFDYQRLIVDQISSTDWPPYTSKKKRYATPIDPSNLWSYLGQVASKAFGSNWLLSLSLYIWATARIYRNGKYSSIRDIWIYFWKLSWGLENDNTLFKQR